MMTFNEWKEGEQWNDHCNPTAFANAAWDAATEQAKQRIDELEKEILVAADIIDRQTNLHCLAAILRMTAQEQE